MSKGGASREMAILKNGVRILGAQSKSISVGSTPIDVTSDEDNGFRLFLDEVGLQTLDISASGVTKDETLRQLALTGGSKLFQDVTIEFPPVGTQTTGDEISGDFYFDSFNENGGGSDGALEYDFTMKSSGEWTLTPGTKP